MTNLVHIFIMSLNTTFMVPLSFFNKIVVETYGMANTANNYFAMKPSHLGVFYDYKWHEGNTHVQ
jgi:hypothetical protein